MTLAPQLLPSLMPLLLVYARIQACLLAMPGLGERMIPIRVRVAAAMALTPLYAGAARPASLPAPLQLAGLVAAEIVAGLALGLMVRVVAMALDMASTALAGETPVSVMTCRIMSRKPESVSCRTDRFTAIFRDSKPARSRA